MSYKRGERRFVAGSTARDERYLGCMARSSIDDLVLGIKSDGWVGQCDRLQSRQHEVIWVVDKVPCCVVSVNLRDHKVVVVLSRTRHVCNQLELYERLCMRSKTYVKGLTQP